MKKPSKIKFDMSEADDISNSIIEINKDFYTKRTSKVRGSIKFPIPKPIVLDLDLHPTDICYFVKYSEGYYISFKHKPEAVTKTQVRSRSLSAAGDYGTLYVCIPPFIKNLYREEITSVELIRTKGFQPYEWQIKFHSSDSI